MGKRTNRDCNIEIAITGYEIVAQIFTREAFPEQWAMLRNNLGGGYLERIRGERAENIEHAISFISKALEVFTSQAFPEQWAITQNNLGEAYLERIQGNKAENIELAIACFKAALVYTREAFPTDWAKIQNNLGTAYSDCIRGERAENLEEAIACFQNALQVYTRSAFPVDWATTQNNLGEAYSDRIRGDKAQNLEQAIASYTAALQVYTRDAFPQDWAMTQKNMGTAYSDRILGDKAHNLEQAIASYTAALQVYTRDAFPQDWAMTQTNLGIAYRDRILGDKAENLEQAIICFQAALTLYTRETFPYQWASTCKNLGNAYTEKIHKARLSNIDGLTNIEYAILYYQDALEVYTQETFPDEWASLRDSLVNAHYILESYQRELKVSSFSQPITRNKAISRIELVRENILDLEVDAIVRPTNTSLSFGGNMSTEMLARLEPECYEKWQNQPKPSIGEVLVTDASSLSARYIFHTPIDYNVDATVATISQAITAALTTAESLGDVRTIAFPSVGTGIRGLNSADLAPKILRIVTTHLEHESQLEKVIFAFRNEFAYRTYVGAYQMLLLEAAVAYEVFMAISPEAALVGGEIDISIALRQVGTTNGEAYVLQVPRSEAAGAELNILLIAPGFQFDGDTTASLPLDLSSDQITQTARFRLTALRLGKATITAELYRGDTFETQLEAKVQVAGLDEASFTATRITTQPRPVPQPDFILRLQTAWNVSNSACRFQYQLRSFRLPSLFPGETNYHSESLSSRWIEQMRGLLGTTLENISDALPEDGRSRLTSLGQYLFQRLLPTELQSDFRNLIPRNYTFTLLILADQDASLPWELLHDGQQFLCDRFIIGRWFWELNDTRPHEFPVGAINVAHYADVEQPELWAALLEPPGASPPLPLPEGVLGNLDSTEAMRGLHLIRYSQSSDTANRRNAPVTLDDTNNTQDIERQMRPAKLNLRRNRPLVSLGYLRRDRPELTTLEQTWASAFIRAGCSAFTGSLWAVDPAVEAAFISGFYNRLWTGDSLGEAFHASRQLARAVAPDSLDWLAYVLFGDPMARPYRPVEGKGYAVVEPIGREIDDPLPPGVPVRFRLSLRRTPLVWHEERVIEVAENLTFENLQAHVKTFGLQVIPDSPIAMSLAPTGNYLGWFTLVAPPEMAGNSALVQVFLMDGMQPIHSLMFSLNIENEEGSSA